MFLKTFEREIDNAVPENGLYLINSFPCFMTVLRSESWQTQPARQLWNLQYGTFITSTKEICLVLLCFGSVY